jgi:hypothetical protein
MLCLLHVGTTTQPTSENYRIHSDIDDVYNFAFNISTFPAYR